MGMLGGKCAQVNFECGGRKSHFDFRSGFLIAHVLRRLSSSSGEEDFNLEQFGPEFACDRPLNLDRESAGGLKGGTKVTPEGTWHHFRSPVAIERKEDHAG
jgi:hypothetical protein